MKTHDTIKHLGNAAKAAKAINCSRFNHWNDYCGGIISEQAAIRFVLISNGELELVIDDYRQEPAPQAA